MTIPQALILGLIQGLTEFLPVSSSGHLVIGHKLLGLSKPPVIFDIVIHVGTLTAVLVFFRSKIITLIKQTISQASRGSLGKLPSPVWAIIVGTMPAVIVGLLLNNYLEKIFNSLFLVSVTLLITAALLFSTTLIDKSKKNLEKVSGKDGLVIGIFQALAILPGISRSGSTVVAGLWRKLNREAAFTFSFLLSIPAIIGAMILQIKDFSGTIDGQALPTVVGFMTAAFSGYFGLVVFKKTIVQGKLVYFGGYCLIISSAVIFSFLS